LTGIDSQIRQLAQDEQDSKVFSKGLADFLLHWMGNLLVFAEVGE
jgi:hypothetical protein